MARKPITADVPDQASPLEQPSAGGSYVRQPAPPSEEN
jgi:hypothetical protein